IPNGITMKRKSHVNFVTERCPMNLLKYAFPLVVGFTLAASLAFAQTPPSQQLQPGTYNTPAGSGATPPALPSSTIPSLAPNSTFPNSLNRNILNPSQGVWLQHIDRGMRRTNLEDKAVIVVKLPAADGNLWVNGRRTKQTGEERLFVTPALEPGK